MQKGKKKRKRLAIAVVIAIAAVTLGLYSWLTAMARDREIDNLLADFASHQTPFKDDAAAQIKALRSPRDINRLIYHLANDEGNERGVVPDAIGLVGEPAVEPLANAFRSIAKRPDRSIPGLFFEPSDAEHKRRTNVSLRFCAAMNSLGKLGSDLLLKLLWDEDADVRSTAALALCLDPGAHNPLTTEACMRALNNPDQSVRMTAMMALSRGRYRPAIDALINLTADRDPSIRAQAYGALSTFADDERVAPRLLMVMRDPRMDRYVRGQVVRSLGRMRDPQVLDILLGALKDPDKSVRDGAERGLMMLFDDRKWDAVAPLLRHGDSGVRAAAIKFFSDSPDLRGVKALSDAHRSATREDKAAIVRALKSIKALGEPGTDPRRPRPRAFDLEIPNAAKDALAGFDIADDKPPAPPEGEE